MQRDAIGQHYGQYCTQVQYVRFWRLASQYFWRLASQYFPELVVCIKLAFSLNRRKLLASFVLTVVYDEKCKHYNTLSLKTED
jgi:uncharacterized membrane protein (DUF485 family)